MLQTVIAPGVSTVPGPPGPQGLPGALVTNSSAAAAGLVVDQNGDVSTLVAPAITFPAGAPTFTANSTFGTSAFTNSVGLVSGVIAAALPVASSVKFVIPPGDTAFQVVLGGDSCFHFAIGNGTVFCNINDTQFASGVVSTNAVHQASISIGLTNTVYMLDNVVVGSIATSSLPPGLLLGSGVYFGIGTEAGNPSGSLATGIQFTGSIAEVSFWDTDQFPTAGSQQSGDYTGTEAGLTSLFHLRTDASNSGPAVKVLAGAAIKGVAAGLAIDPVTRTLSSPNIAPKKMVFLAGKPGYTGSSQLNAMLAECTHVEVQQGTVDCSPGAGGAVLVPSNTALIGLGSFNPSVGADQNPGGGVLLTAGFNPPNGALKLAGQKLNPTTSAGFVSNAVVGNISTYATTSGAAATGRAPIRLVDMRNTYKRQIYDVAVSGDFYGGFYSENEWDCYGENFQGRGVGFSDPHATADSAATQLYTGRSFTGLETSIGRSLGVPFYEIYSPDASGNGQDTVNNSRHHGGHFETDSEAAVGVLIHGTGTVDITFSGQWKIELTEGPQPMFAAEGAMGLVVQHLWVFGAGNGFPYNSYGGTTANESWGALTNPGLILLGRDMIKPRLTVTAGYAAGASPLQAFVRAIGAEYPCIDLAIDNGIAALTPPGAGAIVLDGCGQCSAAHVDAYTRAYSRGASTAIPYVPYVLLNGSTRV